MADGTMMCPFGDDCQNDTAVNLLRFIFDEQWINAFITSGQNPALVKATANPDTIMPILVSQVSSISLMIALMILCFYLISLFLSSTNDGEIKGFSRGSGSFLGTYGRPLFAVVMLLPTPSGYPLIGVIIMALVLNSNGMANKAYEAYANRSLKTSSILDFEKNEAFKASNSLMDAAYFGAMHGYCAKSAKHHLGGMRSKANILSNDTDGGTTELKLVLEDADGYSNVQGEFCGTFSVKMPNWDFADQRSGNMYADYKELLGKSQSEIQKIGSEIRAARGAVAFSVYKAAFKMTAGSNVYQDVAPGFDDMGDRIKEYTNKTIYKETVTQLNAIAQGRADSYGSEGWPVWTSSQENTTAPSSASSPDGSSGNASALPQTAKIGPIQKMARDMTAGLTASILYVLEYEKMKGDAFEQHVNSLGGMKAMEQRLMAQGWMGAGSSRTRMNAVRRGVVSSLYGSPVSFGVKTHAPRGENEEEFDNHVSANSAMLEALQREVAYSTAGGSGESLNSVFLTMAKSSSTSDQTKNDFGGGTLSKMLLNAERQAVETIIGTSISSDKISFEHANGDILARIQDAGETFGIVRVFAVNVELTAVAAYTLLGSTGKHLTAVAAAMPLGTGTPVAAIGGAMISVANMAEQIYQAAGKPFFEEVKEISGNVATMLGVVIPTLPFLLLAMAGVGWFLQVIMTMFGMPLFLIMHALPGDRFMGSQQQGYVTLLALFFRPILIITAFFLAFAIYEPLVIYFTRAFFFIRGEVAGVHSDNDFSALASVVVTLRDYWYIYSASLIMMTYLIFGLVQELGDNILDWLGTNLLRNFGNLNSDRLMSGAAGAALAGRKLADKKIEENNARMAKEREKQRQQADAAKNQPDADKAAEARQNQMDDIAGGAKALGSGASSAPADKTNAAKAALADGKIGTDRADGEFNATADGKGGAQGDEQQDRLGGESIDTSKADGVDTNDATDEGPVTDLNDKDDANASEEGQDINTDGAQDGAKGAGGEGVPLASGALAGGVGAGLASKAPSSRFGRMLSKLTGRGAGAGSALGSGSSKAPVAVSAAGKDAGHIDNKAKAGDASRSAALGATGGNIPLDRQEALPASARDYSMKTNADGSVTESYKHKDASGNELSTTATTNADGSGKLVTTGTDSQGREFSATSVFGAGGEKLSTETTGFNENGAAVTRTESFDGEGNVSAVQESVESDRGKYTTTTESHADGSTTVTAMGVSGNGSFTSKETYNAAGEMTSRSETAKDAAGNTEYSISEARSMNGGTNTVATTADGKTTSTHNPNGMLKSNGSTAMGAGAGSVLSGNAAAVALNSHRPLDLPSQNNGGGSSNVTGGTTPSGAPLGDANGAVVNQVNQGTPAGVADSASTAALGTGTSDGNAVGGADVGLNAAQGGMLANPNSYTNGSQDAVLGSTTAANNPGGEQSTATAVSTQDGTGTTAFGTGAATPVNGAPVGSNSHISGQSNVPVGSTAVTNPTGGHPTAVSATAGAVGTGATTNPTPPTGGEVKLNTTYSDTAQQVLANGTLHGAGSYTNGGLNLHNAGSPVQQGGTSPVEKSPVQIPGGNNGQSANVATTQVTQVTDTRAGHVGAQAVHTGGNIADRAIITPAHVPHGGVAVNTDRSNAVLNIERKTALGTAKTSAPPNHLSAPQSAITVALHNALSGGHSGGNNPVSGHFNPLTQAVTASPVVANRHNLVVSQRRTDVTSVQQPSVDSTQTTTRATVIYDDANSSASDAISINQAQTAALSVDFTRVTDKVKALPMMADPEPSTPEVQMKGEASHDGRYAATDRSSFGGAFGKIANFIGLGKKE